MAEFRIRDGRSEDAAVLCELVNYAGEGLPLYLWEQSAGPDKTAWDVGFERAQREEGAFSYRNAHMALADDQVVGALIGYSIGPEPEPIGPDMPAMFVPLQELENLAPNSWYVNVLAAVPERRGEGVGTLLLSHADQVGREAGSTSMSIIVADNNSGARRLYERTGYAEIARRPMVKDGWENDGAEWVLLVKPLASQG